MPELEEADKIQHEAYDRYITVKVCVPKGGEMSYGTVKNRKRRLDGDLMGRSNANPILDTSIYEVEFDDGSTEAYTVNIIAEHIYSQVDGEGYTQCMLNEIVDHKKDNMVVTKEDGLIPTKSGRKLPKRTTKGWQFLCQWNDGTTSWHPLKDVKESHLLQVAQHAVNNGLAEEPAFAWWVPHTVKKRDRIIKAAKKRYFRIHQKYGTQIPKTVREAQALDTKTGTTFWMDAISSPRISYSGMEDNKLQLQLLSLGVNPGGRMEQLGCWLNPACQTGKLPNSCTTLWCIQWWMSFPWSKSMDWTFHHLDTGGQLTYMDAIRKEMKNCSKAFEMLPEGSRIPVGHTHIKCHLIFDVKHGSLERKAPYVAGGHMTAPPQPQSPTQVL